MKDVVNSTDFVKLAAGYATFLFALGGVGITVLTLVLALRQDERPRHYPGLVSSVILFVLSCFVGAHLFTEASALQEYGDFKATDLARTYFVLAESNIFTASCLLVLVLVLLPLTYETKETQPLRPFLGWLGGLFIACVLLWLGATVVYLGEKRESVIFAIASTLVLFGLGAWATRGGVYRFWVYVPAVLSCVITEIAVAVSMERLHKVGSADIWVFIVATALGVGPVSGVGAAYAWQMLRKGKASVADGGVGINEKP